MEVRVPYWLETDEGFVVGEWEVYPRRNALVQGSQTVQVEPKVMHVLVCLAKQPGRATTREELMDAVWADEVVIGAVLTRAISALRKALNDDFRQPRYIETLPKSGYRLLATVTPLVVPDPVLPAVQPALGSSSQSSRVQAYGGALSVVALLLCLVLLWGMRSGDAVEPPTFYTVPVTSWPGNEYDAALSPSGTHLAFAWAPRLQNEYGFTSDIYVKDLATEAVTQLTDTSVPEHGPTWAPDGRFIAFIRQSEEGCHIIVVPIWGGTERALGTCGFNMMADLTWSPDSKTLAFSDRSIASGPNQIILLDIETETRQVLTHVDKFNAASRYLRGDTQPVFSPDGQWLAFARNVHATTSNLFVIPVGGGEAHPLTHGTHTIDGFDWLPGNEQVVFATRSDDNHSLWTVHVSGKDAPKRYLGLGASLRGPTVARETQRLAGERVFYDINLWALALDDTQQPHGEPERWFASTRADWSPTFSSNGKQLAFASNRTGKHELWLGSIDQENPIRLTGMNASFTGRPQWSPTDHRLVFESHPNGNADLYLTNANGSLPQRLTEDAGMDIAPSWSPLGDAVYFGSNRTGDWQIWKLPLDGREATQVTSEGGAIPQLSPDAQWLYYTKHGTRGLWRQPLKGGAEERIVENLHPTNATQWVVRASGVYYLTGDKQGVFIARYSFETGATVLVHRPKKRLPMYVTTPSLTVSPDERWLLFGTIDRSESDIILVEQAPF